MQVKIWLSIDTKDKSSSAIGEKTVKSSVAPTPGMMLADGAWSDERPIRSVSFSTENPDELTVFVGRETAQSEADFRARVDMYRSWKWTVKVAGERG